MGKLYEMVSSPCLPIVLCTFMWSCYHVGIMKVIGVYLEDISNDLGTTATDLGLALGLLTLFCNFPTVIIAALYRRRSIRRKLLICGACLPPLGMALISMATSNLHIAISLSIAGLGICIQMLNCIMALHLVAKENYNVLYGLGVTGYGVGMVLFPLIAEFLRGTYGWRGGLLILSALMAHIIPCAAKINLDVYKTNKQLNGSDSNYLALPDSEEVCPEGCERKTNREGRARDQSGINTTQVGVWRRITTIIRQSDFFVDPYFNAAHVVNISFSMVYACWHSFIVPHALERGLSIRYTIILTFIASIGNIISRTAVGILTKNIFHPTDVYIFATLVSIVSLLCDVYFVNCVAMIMTSCFSAMSIGGRAALEILYMRDRASPEKFDVALAVDKFCFGIGAVLGGYLGGMIADRFSSFEATFRMLPVIETIVLIPMLILRCNPKEIPHSS
ncbi:monocarboxylate transporter 6-like [Lytechinus pictus]|uniref:monocarboxylate transporter 6-like n=1 Tax=Lytechinus pictus TaxID=7653 RepID=UPI0030B9E5BB